MNKPEPIEWSSEMKYRALAGLVVGTRWKDMHGKTRLIRRALPAKEDGAKFLKLDLQRGSTSAQNFYIGVKTGEWTPGESDVDAAKAQEFVRKMEADTASRDQSDE